MPNHVKFHYKLWQLVNSANDAVIWNETGESILVDMRKLKNVITSSEFCKSQNISSFVRQLNLYGFKMVVTLDDPRKYLKEYCNPDFKRRRPDLLKSIVRKGSVYKSLTRRKQWKSLRRKRHSEEFNNLSTAMFDPAAVRVKEELIDEEHEESRPVTQVNSAMFDLAAVKVKEELIDEEYEKTSGCRPTEVNPRASDPASIKVRVERIDGKYGKKSECPNTGVNPQCVPSTSKDDTNSKILHASEYFKVLEEMPLVYRTRNKKNKLANILTSNASHQDAFDPASLKVKQERITEESKKTKVFHQNTGENTALDVFDPASVKVIQEHITEECEEFKVFRPNAGENMALMAESDVQNASVQFVCSVPPSYRKLEDVFGPAAVKEEPIIEECADFTDHAGLKVKEELLYAERRNDRNSECCPIDLIDAAALKVKEELINEVRVRNSECCPTARDNSDLMIDPATLKVKKEPIVAKIINDRNSECCPTARENSDMVDHGALKRKENLIDEEYKEESEFCPVTRNVFDPAAAKVKEELTDEGYKKKSKICPTTRVKVKREIVDDLYETIDDLIEKSTELVWYKDILPDVIDCPEEERAAEFIAVWPYEGSESDSEMSDTSEVDVDDSQPSTSGVGMQQNDTPEFDVQTPILIDLDSDASSDAEFANGKRHTLRLFLSNHRRPMRTVEPPVTGEIDCDERYLDC